MNRLLCFLLLLSVQKFCFSQHDGKTISLDEWDRILQQSKSDTLYLTDEFNKVTYQVSANDYFQQLKSSFPDSITQVIVPFLKAANDNIKNKKLEDHLIDADFYLSMPFYDRPQALTFDRILHDLFVSEKLILARGDKQYTVKQVRIKSKRYYCCHDPLLYCGKDWVVYYHGRKLTTFSKSVTKKTYVMRSCF